MKSIAKNLDYFLKEIRTILKLDLASNLLSIVSLSFIFFLLSMLLAGGWSINYMMESIESQAEISVYYFENSDMNKMLDDISNIDGVLELSSIDEGEAKKRMTEIMGEESRILELFDHNPFSPYIEVRIDLDNMDTVADSIRGLEGVDLVRDNKAILENLRGISNLANILGILVIAAVSIATLVITSHIIRQGIYANRDEINTLRLLGAPESFITFPYILEGLFMSLLAALLSLGMVALVIKFISSRVTGYLPFVVLPNYKDMVIGISIFIIVLSFILGLLGCILGLKSTKE